MTSIQLVVIGGGPGGYAAAFLAADLGMRVALVDPEVNPGGVCVYRGCIPSKALLHAANVLQEARHAAAWGIEFGPPRIDITKLRDFKESVVKRLTNGTGQLVKFRHVSYLQGLAEIVDPHRVRVKLKSGGDEEVQFEHAILATGSLPAIPPALALDDPRVMDSTAALDLPDVPKSLLVVGGGYIGLELGTVYAALGSAVTVVEMTAGLLPGADRDLVDVLAKRVGQTFKSVRLNARVVGMEAHPDGIRVSFEGASGAGGSTSSSQETFDRVLVSVGRRPNSKIPGLERTRVQVDQRGFIMVDEQRRTHEPSMFAIGDVVGEPMLAHKASHEGRVAVEVIAGDNVAFAPRAIPAVVFTDPELAWCGLTQSQAEREKKPIAVAKFPWAASGRALTLDRSDGLTKLIIDPETERLLGVGIVGPGAGELIAEGVVAIEMGANATDVKLSIHPHPTLSETLMESAEVFFGQATHVYRPKKAG
ncbi:MAG TPA: dihydrolipoyl dehydrogenase [Vicinamibacterales bacterium]|nr:dihydrolipoyl dehydrogenase [Vicinamibacterales bacterium]